MLTLFFVNGDAIPLCFTCASYHMTIPLVLVLYTYLHHSYYYVLTFYHIIYPASTI